MKNVKGWIRVEFYAELPDDDLAADSAFDELCDAVDSILNESRFPHALAGSFSIGDAGTEEADLDD